MKIINRIYNTLICHIYIIVFGLTFIAQSHVAFADTGNFWRLGATNGLANDEVKCISQDVKGYIWFGTKYGLSRYDGYRFKNFYSDFQDYQSLPSSDVSVILHDIDDNLWLRTVEGWCIFYPTLEKVNRDLSSWMREHGMRGVPDYVVIDNHKNFYISVLNVGCYYYSPRSGRVTLIPVGIGSARFPQGRVLDYSLMDKYTLLVMSNGDVVMFDGETGKIVRRYDKVIPRGVVQLADGGCLLDKELNAYVYAGLKSRVVEYKTGQRFGSIPAYLAEKGIVFPRESVYITDATFSPRGNIWIATMNNGLWQVMMRQHQVFHFQHNPMRERTLPDNSILDLFFDSHGSFWIGTKRNGVAYLNDVQTLIPFYPVGDISTIVQDKQGKIWLGTNDRGVLTFNPNSKAHFEVAQGSRILGGYQVTGSTLDSNSILYFGLNGGGVATMRDGQLYKIYTKANSQLASDDVTSLCSDRSGHIYIGTQTAGVQCFDTRTGKWQSYNKANSRLLSNGIVSVSIGRDGLVIVAHAEGLSFIDSQKGTVRPYVRSGKGDYFSAYSITQAIQDSRGLVWVASMSGIDVVNLKTDRIQRLFDSPKAATSLVEDKHHNIWAAVEHGMIRISVRKSGGQNAFISTYFDNDDGLQNRRMNFRSILLSREGNVVVGGPDGINIIRTNALGDPINNAKALFSGLVLFNKPLRVGETYGGKIILEKELNEMETLKLSNTDNTFTILLASNHVKANQRVSFLYRLKGLSEHWITTSDVDHSVTFNNLEPGHYVLQVRVVDRDGSVSNHISELKIVIEPPLYRSGIAIVIYLLVLATLLFFYYRWKKNRDKQRRELHRVREDAQRQIEMDEMKLRYLANVGHEIRTPLALIVAPVKALMKDEKDDEKRELFRIILRSAVRMLRLVNQTLDIRRLDKFEVTPTWENVDIMSIARQVYNGYNILIDSSVQLSVHLEPQHFIMTTDGDKLDKIIINLVSNAFKFARKGGRVDISMKVIEENGSPQHIVFSVANTGDNIPDDEKVLIFDRYYQGSKHGDTSFYGTGIGLSLVKTYTEMLGGTVTVIDHPEGGAVFSVMLPYRYDNSLPVQEVDTVDFEEPLERMNDLDKDERNAIVDRAKEIVDGGVYRVLVVDDSDDFRSFMAEQLSQFYRVSVASNGVEALQIVEKSMPDIILSDVMMPEMDGNALCKAIKSNPATAHIPFVMLTARLTNQHRVEGLTNGADEYITKPFDFDLLNLRLAKYIQWSKGSKEVKYELNVRQEKKDAITPVDAQFVKKATEYVEERLDNPNLSVERMSDDLQMSRVHLYKRLLSTTGNTPSEFIRIIRLQKAAALLRESNYNVSEVAYKVGFNNPRYFSKYFKDFYGVLPTQYRHPSGDDADATVADKTE